MLLSLFLLACSADPAKDATGDDTAGLDDTAGGDNGGGNGGNGGDTGDTTEYERYACGWEKRDPGTLVSTGSREGDVLADITLVDQCGEDFRVWDMYQEYFILFVTAAW